MWVVLSSSIAMFGGGVLAVLRSFIVFCSSSGNTSGGGDKSVK